MLPDFSHFDIWAPVWRTLRRWLVVIGATILAAIGWWLGEGGTP